MSSFQDQKFSDVHYNGYGGGLRLDYSLDKHNYWDFGVTCLYYGEHAKTYDVGAAKIVDVRPFITYMRPLFRENTQTLYAGATTDMSFYMRTTQQLYNNASYLIPGYSLKIPVRYVRRINDKWTLDAGLSFQLFGYIHESASFTYTTSQYVLEEGKFSYDELPSTPNFVPLWKYLDIRTHILFEYGKRWVFGYRWNMSESFQVPGYPMIKGYSALTVGFRLVNRIKEKN